jgi:hypothetical protein
MEVLMVLIKVQYDAYNRQFKVLDRDLMHLLDDGETYVLIADVSIEDVNVTDAETVPIQVEAAPV